MDDRVPRQVAGLSLAELDGETLLYSHDHLRMLHLNDSAAAVWRLCDGARSVNEIVGVLAAAYPEASRAIDTEVPAIIDRLVGERVLALD